MVRAMLAPVSEWFTYVSSRMALCVPASDRNKVSRLPLHHLQSAHCIISFVDVAVARCTARGCTASDDLGAFYVP